MFVVLPTTIVYSTLPYEFHDIQKYAIIYISYLFTTLSIRSTCKPGKEMILSGY